MLGESGIGIYAAYAALWALVLLIVVLFLRVALSVSLLWILPIKRLFRRKANAVESQEH